MVSKLTSTLAALVAFSLVTGQPAKLAWSRTSSYPGVSIDTVGHGIVNSAGNFVIVGANQQDGMLPKGNITIFNRKTAAMQSIDIIPPGNGPLGLSRIMEDEGIYYVFGTTRPVGTNADKIYVGKFDANLNLITHTTFAANTYSGTESVTDVGINDNNKIFMTGLAQKNNIWQVWTAATDPPIDTFALNFQKVDVASPTLPELTVNGIIAILIGFVGNNGPVLRSYQPTGPLNYSFGATQTGSFQVVVLENTMISGYSLIGTSWTEEPTPGTFVSHAAISKVNGSTGIESGRYDLPTSPGVSSIVFEDIVISSLSTRRVNVLTRRNGVAENLSLNFDLVPQSTWLDNQASSVANFVGAPPWGDILMSLGRENSIECLKGLAINNATKFSINAPVYNMLLPYIEQQNLFHLESGDFLAIRSDPYRMQVNCIQQAPTAVTDSYQAKSGVTFRPPNPVFSNDRYALGSGITIVEQPMHGTVTMGSNGFFAYKSTPGYVGPDSFKYRLTKVGLNTSQATININVKP